MLKFLKSRKLKPTHLLRRYDRQSGMSLLEVFVALGVLGTVIVSSTMYFGSANRNKQKARLRKVQKSIASVIQNAIKSPANIFYSVARYDVNPSLASCVLNIDLGVTDQTCNDAIDRGSPKQFALFSITSQDGLSALQLSSGQESVSAMSYDINGKPCNRRSKIPCFFEVVTEFYAACKGDDEDNCRYGASQVYFTFKVKQKESGMEEFFGNWKLPDYPKHTRYISMSPTQILGPDRFSECGSDAFDQGLGDIPYATFEATFSRGEGFYGTLTGYDKYGRPKCECLYPFRWVEDREDSESGVTYPVCELIPRTDLTCESGSFLRGVDTSKDKKSVVCKNALEAFDCSDTHTSGDKCSEQYYIKKYIIKNCTFRCVYLPDQIRTCTFAWTAETGVSTQGVPVEADGGGSESSFKCLTHEIACCKPKVDN